MRVGFGYDVHCLVENRPLILGGVNIPFSLGLAGHSDADVLIHSIIDALIGAAGMGDIGKHFPDTDPTYKDADSRVLLIQINEKIKAQGWQIENMDTTIVAEKPKLSSYIEEMRLCLAETLALQPAVINIKAKTTEGLGFAGRSEGIAAYAVVLLDKNK